MHHCSANAPSIHGCLKLNDAIPEEVRLEQEARVGKLHVRAELQTIHRYRNHRLESLDHEHTITIFEIRRQTRQRSTFANQ